MNKQQKDDNVIHMANTEKVYIKRVDGVVPPIQAKSGDAGYDVIATSDPEITETYIQYRTGLFLKIPEDCYVDIRPRSSISKTNLVLCNSVGLCDSGYLGEYLVRFKYIPDLTLLSINAATMHEFHLKLDKIYKKGDKIAQLVIRKRSEMDFTFVDNFDTFTSDRGDGGHGSTGN